MSLRKSVIIEKAQKLVLKGNFKQAIEEWRKLAAETPNDGNIYNAIGDLYLKAKDKESAIAAFIQSADAFHAASFELKSIALYKKVLKVDPSKVEICEKLAAVYADRGLIGNAIDDYLKAAKHYFKQGDFRASLSVYRKISNFDPENIEIHLKIAEMCQNQELINEAVEEYKKVVALYDAANESELAEEIRERISTLDPTYAVKEESASQESLKQESIEEEQPEEIEVNMDEAALPEGDMGGFLEPEPEPMAEEQTLYETRNPVFVNQGVEENASANSGKSLEDALTEVAVYTQYGLIEQAIDQLHTISESFPSEAKPHVKLKEIYCQQGMTKNAIEECSILAALYSRAGNEEARKSILNDLEKLDSVKMEKTTAIEETPGFTEHPSGQSIDRESEIDADQPHEIGVDPPNDTGTSPTFDFQDDPFSKLISEEDSFSIDFSEPTLVASEAPASSEKPIENEQVQETLSEQEVLSGIDESSKDNKGIVPASHKKHISEEYIDLNAIISEDLEDEQNEHTLDRTIRYFQAEAQSGQNEQESETQYDLGIAYKEMGMIPEAMKAFELASQSESRFEDANIMLASCYRESKSTASAINLLQKVLSDRNSQVGEMIALKYEMALLYETLGDVKAPSLYQEIFGVDPTFRDVSKKCQQSPFGKLDTSSEQETDAHQPTNAKKSNQVSFL